MTQDQLAGEVKSLAAKIIKLPEDKISLTDSLFNDLGVDSMLGVEIFAALDKKYGVNIPEKKLKHVATLNDIVVLVRELKSR
ncbi:acyl carrier protein [Candidatus Margulisiibacteriota bacterium]